MEHEKTYTYLRKKERNMAKVTFDYSAAKNFISDAELEMMERIAEDAKKTLVEKTGSRTIFYPRFFSNRPIKHLGNVQSISNKIQLFIIMICIIGRHR